MPGLIARAIAGASTRGGSNEDGIGRRVLRAGIISQAEGPGAGILLAARRRRGGGGLLRRIVGGPGRNRKPRHFAKEFMGKFVKAYLKSYAKAIFLQAKDELDEEPNYKKLEYRDWTSVEPPELFTGECYMKTGPGPCAFNKWKKVFIAETDDCNIAIYANESKYEAGKKPMTVISTAGYALQDNPSEFYRGELEAIAPDLGMKDKDVNKETNFSQYSWALTHPWRPNYIFQLHFIKKRACSCGSVEPEDAGSEFAELREEYLAVFRRTLLVNKGRNRKSISGRAFDLTVAKLVARCDNLEHFKDDGTEAEILTDMLLDYCLVYERERILFIESGSASSKLQDWYKKRELIRKILKLLSKPIWGTAQKAAQALADKVAPTLGKGLKPIIKVKESIKKKIQDKLSDKMSKFIDKHVAVYVEPLTDTFANPMTKGFDCIIDIFKKHVNTSELPEDRTKRNIYLDGLPRSIELTSEISEAAEEVVEGIETLNSLHGNRFSEVDEDDIKSEIEMTILETLDAAVYSLQCLLDENGKSENCKENILEALAHDMPIVRGDFVRRILQDLLISGFQKAIEPITKPIIKTLDFIIPKELEDLINVKTVYDDLVRLLVGGAVNKVVNERFPKPSAAVEKLVNLPKPGGEIPPALPPKPEVTEEKPPALPPKPEVTEEIHPALPPKPEASGEMPPGLEDADPGTEVQEDEM